MDKRAIGITGTGSLIGQAIIKSVRASRLKDRVRMVGFDYFPETIGSYWVDTGYVWPDFLKKDVSEDMWLGRVIEDFRRENIQAVLIGTDLELRLFAKHKQLIERETSCRVVVSDPEVIRIADDKYLTFVFLKDHGLSFPETFLVEDLDRDRIRFPCVVKPRIGFRSLDVRVIGGWEELKSVIRGKKGFIVQELVGTPDREYTCGVVFLDGEVKESVILRRILKDGNTVTAYYDSKTPKVIGEYIQRIAINLKPYGSCNFQLRHGDDGVPKLFEINARHSGTTYFRALFGFNEVEYIISHLFGFSFEKQALKEGCVKRYYEERFFPKS